MQLNYTAIITGLSTRKKHRGSVKKAQKKASYPHRTAATTVPLLRSHPGGGWAGAGRVGLAGCKYSKTFPFVEHFMFFIANGYEKRNFRIIFDVRKIKDIIISVNINKE